MERKITQEIIQQFTVWLMTEEKSKNTVEKYRRDVVAFTRFLNGKEVDKETVITYKQHLLNQKYAIRSINSMLASLNSLFAFLGWYDCRVKAFRLQTQIFRPEEKELTKAEYLRLCRAAQK